MQAFRRPQVRAQVPAAAFARFDLDWYRRLRQLGRDAFGCHDDRSSQHYGLVGHHHIGAGDNSPTYDVATYDVAAGDDVATNDVTASSQNDVATGDEPADDAAYNRGQRRFLYSVDERG